MKRIRKLSLGRNRNLDRLEGVQDLSFGGTIPGYRESGPEDRVHTVLPSNVLNEPDYHRNFSCIYEFAQSKYLTLT